ncbi:MAG: TerC family protein [Candidatus Nanopelagicales bacterium]
MSIWIWVATVVVILGLLALDFAISHKPHHVGIREATWWSVFYIAVAVVFGIVIFWWQGTTAGTEFFSAYLVEKSLSVDNLFVFAIIFAKFLVPDALQQRVLLFGIILALVFRTIFIAVGAAALAYFSFTFVIFGALLIWTGIQLARHRNEDPEPSENLVTKLARKRFTVTDDYHGTAFFTKIDGVKAATPLLLVVIAVGSTDLLFALDSIPATFGVTQDPYLVFAANAFALLGLRALFFLLKGLLDRLVYLSLGLAVILVFIGIKLVLTWAHENWASVPKIPTLTSLAVIVVILAITAIASLIKTRQDPTAVAHAGTVTKPKHSEGASNSPERSSDEQG